MKAMATPVTVRFPRPPRSVTIGQVTPSRAAWGTGVSDEEFSEVAEAQQQLEQARLELREETERLRQARAALECGVGRLNQLQADVASQGEAQLLELALDIARKVLAQEIQAGRYEVEPIVAEAMKQLPARCDVTVHLHGDDFARCAAEQDTSDSPGLRWLADANVAPGECLLDTDQGTIASTVDGQLAEIAEALKQPE